MMFDKWAWSVPLWYQALLIAHRCNIIVIYRFGRRGVLTGPHHDHTRAIAVVILDDYLRKPPFAPTVHDIEYG